MKFLPCKIKRVTDKTVHIYVPGSAYCRTIGIPKSWLTIDYNGGVTFKEAKNYVKILGMMF